MSAPVSEFIFRRLKSVFSRLQARQERVSLPVKIILGVLSLPFILLWIPLIFINRNQSNLFDLTSETFFGDRFYCRSMDVIETYLYLFGVWEPDISAFIEERLEPGDGFVDVGANNGYYSLLAGRKIGPSGQVVAIEASPGLAREFECNMELNGDPSNVTLVVAAAADRAGSVPVYSGPVFNRGWTTVLKERGFALETEVQGAPLRELLPEEAIPNIRLIKIDVEGAEPGVIRGLDTLWDSLPSQTEFIIELSPDWWPRPKPAIEEVLKPFLDRGYRPYRLDNSYWPWRYLWPRATRRPRQIKGPIKSRWGQVDLVLSRTNAEAL